MSTPDNTTGFLAVHTAGGPKTIYLPAASTRIGRVITIKDVDGAARTNGITIYASGSDTIDGVNTLVLIDRPYGFYSFTAQSSTNWSITNKDLDTNITVETITASGAYLSTLTFVNQRGNAPATLTDNAFQMYVSNSVLYYQDTCLVPAQPNRAVMLDINVASTVRGLGTAGYISSVTGGSGDITSTIVGLGTFGYISSTQLQSSILGAMSTTSTMLQNWAYYNAASSITFQNTQVGTLNSLVTRGDTFLGLQTEVAVLAFNQARDTVGFGGQSYTITSDIRNIGSGGDYSYTLAAGSNYTGNISALTITYPQLLTTQIAPFYISTLYFGNIQGTTYGQLYSDATNTDLYWNGAKINNADISPALRSTVQGLGTVGYLSSASNLVSSLQLASTVTGLGTAGYISSAQLISTTAGLVQIPELTSTTLGLGTLGYLSTFSNFVSTLSLASSITGLGSAGYISSAQLISTTAGLVEIQELTSTTRGLGTLNYLSSLQLFSTVGGLGTFGYVSSFSNFVSSPSLISTVAGLGTTNYLSSGVIRSLSTINLSAAVILTSSFTNGTTFFNDYSRIPTGVVTSLYSSTNYLLYNSSIIGGARVAEIQTIVF